MAILNIFKMGIRVNIYFYLRNLLVVQNSIFNYKIKMDATLINEFRILWISIKIVVQWKNLKWNLKSQNFVIHGLFKINECWNVIIEIVFQSLYFKVSIMVLNIFKSCPFLNSSISLLIFVKDIISERILVENSIKNLS